MKSWFFYKDNQNRKRFTYTYQENKREDANKITNEETRQLTARRTTRDHGHVPLNEEDMF